MTQARVVTVLLAVVALFHLAANAAGLAPAMLRPLHVGSVLVAVFVTHPAAQGARRPGWFDLVCAALAVAAIGYAIVGGVPFRMRSESPRPSDTFFGVACALAVLEALRRMAGARALVVAGGIASLALAGGLGSTPGGTPEPDFARLVGALYQAPAGVFGDLVGVSATTIVLLSVLSACMEASGAFASMRAWASAATARLRNGAAHALVLASALTGAAADSPHAAAAGADSLVARLRATSRYDADAAFGLARAAARGAVIAPPVLGAAVVIAGALEHASYGRLVAAMLAPALLYYVWLFARVALDAGRPGGSDAPCAPPAPGRRIATTLALAALVLLATLVAASVATPLAILAAIAVASLACLFAEDGGVRAIGRAWAAGIRQVLGVAVICATGAIVWTAAAAIGLPARAADLMTPVTGGAILPAALYAAVTIALLGLAVPVTLAYLIGVVMVVPVLVASGASPFGAHMFIVLCAMLSPDLPRRGAAGGDAWRTTLRTWRYTLPAFAVPFVFLFIWTG